MDINVKVVATLYYGHIDDPIPFNDRIMGKVIMRLMEPPWKKLIGVPWSTHFADHQDLLKHFEEMFGGQ